MPNLHILSPSKWPWRAFSRHVRINLDFKGDPVEFENWPDFPVMFPYVLLRFFKITLVSHERQTLLISSFQWTANKKPCPVLNQMNLSRWVQHSEHTRPGPPSLHQPLLGFCLHDLDLGSKNSESAFIPLLFRSSCQYSPAVVLLKTSALGTFIYLSWVFITFLFWSQERSCPFCPWRNKVCSVSSEAAARNRCASLMCIPSCGQQHRSKLDWL